MARIKGVPSHQAGLYVKIAYHFTRRSIGKLTGRETETMIEPLEMYAHVPVGVPYRFRIPDPLGSEPEWRIVNAGATQEVHP